MQRLWWVCMVSFLGGCGQSGPLYLPLPTIPTPVVTSQQPIVPTPAKITPKEKTES